MHGVWLCGGMSYNRRFAEHAATHYDLCCWRKGASWMISTVN